ncbi:MAG: sulfotransferase [Anaerolineae bacterium]|nr:sulfotransferase [Anaerolineae bacterium]
MASQKTFSIERIKPVIKRILGYDRPSYYLKGFTDRRAEIDQVYRTRLQRMVKLDQPLVLISQIQRSGGTLLSQLFDGHPQCHTHPFELHIGHPQKWFWPDLDIKGDSDTWFARLFERVSLELFQEGYSKYSRSRNETPDTYPFLMLPNLQRELFMDCVSSTKISSQRDILNCYMTSYFNAWLDYQQLYAQNVKYIVGFTPRFIMYQESLERFFRDYPDGRLVSILREPKSWYSSAHRHNPKDYPDPNGAVQVWKKSAEEMIKSKANHGDKVYLISFENMLQDVEGCMRSLAAYLGIDFDNTLLTPTFQGMNIKADSSFKVDRHGVIDAPLHRSKHLSGEEVHLIDSQTLDLYEKIVSQVDW